MESFILNCRQLCKSDSQYLSEALELLCRTQGKGIFKPGYLEKCCTDKNTFVVGAFLEEILIGIVRMERHGILRGFYIDTKRVVRAMLVQCPDMENHYAHDRER